VSPVSDVSDEDATRILAWNHARTTQTHGQTGSIKTAFHDTDTDNDTREDVGVGVVECGLYTAADCRRTNQVSSWQAGRGSRRTRPTRTTCYGHPRENVH